MAVSFRLSRDGRAHERPGCPSSSERRGMRDPGMVPRGQNPPHPASRSAAEPARSSLGRDVRRRSQPIVHAAHAQTKAIVCVCIISSEVGGSGGGMRSPDPYLLRVVEAANHFSRGTPEWWRGLLLSVVWGARPAPAPTRRLDGGSFYTPTRVPFTEIARSGLRCSGAPGRAKRKPWP